MRTAKLHAAALLALSVAAAVPAAARAEPFNPDRVAADARYVVHLDMDRVRETKLWPAVDEKLKADPDFMRQVDQVGRMTDMKFPQDLHDVTVYGKAAGEAETVAVVHGHVDRTRVTALLQMNQGFSSKTVGQGHDVLSWDDNGKTKYGSFFDDSTVVIGQDSAHVEDALAVLDDKAKAVKAGEGVAVGVKAKQLVYVGVRDAAALKLPGNSPVVQKIDGGWLAVDEADDNVLATARLQAKDEQSAKQVAGTLNGLVAMAGLMNGGGGNANGNAEPAVGALLADALKTATIKADGTAVDLKWPVPLDIAKKVVDQMHVTRSETRRNPITGSETHTHEAPADQK